MFLLRMRADDIDTGDSQTFENPFASLLRAAPPRPPPQPSVDHATETEAVVASASKTIDVQAPRTIQSLPSESASPLRQKPKANHAPPLRTIGGLPVASLSVRRAKETTHRVAIEAAATRPSRWQRQAPVKVNKNRQSLARLVTQKKQDKR